MTVDNVGGILVGNREGCSPFLQEYPRDQSQEKAEELDGQGHPVGQQTETVRVVEEAGSSLATLVLPYETGGVDQGAEQDGARDEGCQVKHRYTPVILGDKYIHYRYYIGI